MTTLDLEPLLERLAELVAEKLAAKNGNGHQPAEEPDRLLDVIEAAARLGVKPRWLYAHDVPFRVRLPGRAVRFSERGIVRYLKARQGR